MKNAFKTAIKAGVLAAALTLAQAAHATNLTAASQTYYVGPAIILDSHGYDIQPWTVHADNGLDFLAFCIDPSTDTNTEVNNYVAGGYKPLDSVKRLYESAYSQVVDGGYNESKAAAFQLALWTIIAPSRMSLVTGEGTFPGNGDLIQDAINMVNVAKEWELGTGPQYTYTAFTSPDSQRVMTVDIAAAVPEADTLAMLAAGLGMIGFIGRRRSAKRDKFAA